MKALFSPAIALTNRVTYPWKFGLMALLLAVAIGSLVTRIYLLLDEGIGYTKVERQGLAVVRPLNLLIQYTQQHRGLSAGAVGGNQAMAAERESKERQVVEALPRVEEKLSPELLNGAEWKALRDDWNQLKAGGMKMDVTANVAAHNALIAKYLRFQVVVADNYGLILDPEAATYFLVDTALLKLPSMLETVGRMRAMGTGILASHKLEAVQTVRLNSFIDNLGATQVEYEYNLGRTAREIPLLAAALDASARSLQDAIRQIKTIVTDDILTEKFATPPQDFYKRATATLDSGYVQMYDTLLPTLERLLAERIERLRGQLYLNLGVLAVMLLLTWYLATGMYLSIMDSIAALAAGANQIAGGNLTARIQLDSRDELTAVAASFNAVAQAFNDTLRRVRDDAEAVMSAAQRTSHTAAEIAAASQQQSDAAAGMAAAVEEATVGINHISSNSQNTREISIRAGELSVRGAQIVAAVVKEMTETAAAVSASAAAVEALGQRSEEVSAIVGVIKDIAEQTNLLALNAAIEAARAGDQGRGFAVVADEVRKLAERTRHSTEQIGATIATIQSGTQAAVQSMNHGVARVNGSLQQTNRAGETMAEIKDGADQVVKMVRDIADALREQSAASTLIAQNVERVAQMAEENSAAVSENQATATELEKLAVGVQAVVSRFKVSAD